MHTGFLPLTPACSHFYTPLHLCLHTLHGLDLSLTYCTPSSFSFTHVHTHTCTDTTHRHVHKHTHTETHMLIHTRLSLSLHRPLSNIHSDWYPASFSQTHSNGYKPIMTGLPVGSALLLRFKSSSSVRHTRLSANSPSPPPGNIILLLAGGRE